MIGKSTFAVNLLFKLFPATVANADIRSIQSLHTLLKKMFVPHSSAIWTKSYGSNYTKFWAFFSHFGQSIDVILEDISAAEIIV